METTQAVANYFVDRALSGEGADLTQMKLQKLVYYSYGWFLGLSRSEEPLFAEPIQAWRYGPVIESLRDEFRAFGRDPVTRRASKTLWADGQFSQAEYELVDPDRVMPLLHRVWSLYGGYDGVQLSNMTHEVGSPWYQVAAYHRFQIPDGTTIPKELIQNWFRGRVRPTQPA